MANEKNVTIAAKMGAEIAEQEIKTAELDLERMVTVAVAAGRALWTKAGRHAAGTLVKLEASEVDRLKAAGFVTDPPAPASAAPVPAASAPSVKSSEGPTVKPSAPAAPAAGAKPKA